MAQVTAELKSVQNRLEQRDRLDEQRRKVDDERELAAAQRAERILDRLDGVEPRLGKLETRWESFFSDEGVFKSVVLRGISQGKKIDRLSWIAGVGFGIVGTLEVLLLHR